MSRRGAVRDHERAAPLRGKDLGPRETAFATPLAAMEQEHTWRFVVPLRKPGAELFAVAGLDTVFFKLPP